ncbi:hypothetical protein Nepgr_010404 [Nepenthes gracilis]|uniref:Uncharacterized protein n=1 Tax=Nepenthes gracilis TaxID=150966 RepID=A0AAD3XLA5_NEPGR|nr:hypothetical protein Nepgr_010404 [Nepenthes gracilis]
MLVLPRWIRLGSSPPWAGQHATALGGLLGNQRRGRGLMWITFPKLAQTSRTVAVGSEPRAVSSFSFLYFHPLSLYTDRRWNDPARGRPLTSGAAEAGTPLTMVTSICLSSELSAQEIEGHCVMMICLGNVRGFRDSPRGARSLALFWHSLPSERSRFWGELRLFKHTNPFSDNALCYFFGGVKFCIACDPSFFRLYLLQSGWRSHLHRPDRDILSKSSKLGSMVLGSRVSPHQRGITRRLLSSALRNSRGGL